MSDILTLKDIVNDYLQTTSPSVLNQTLELEGSAPNKVTLIDKLILRAANNARKWAEKKHDFSWNDKTLAGTIPIGGLGLGFNKGLYEWPRSTYSMKGGGTTSSITNFDLSRKVSVGSTFYIYEPTVWLSHLCTVTIVAADGKVSFTHASSLTGTYDVYLNWNYGSQYNYFSIKTLHSCFTADTDFVGTLPLRIERKARLTSRLIENVENLQEGNEITWSGQRLIHHGNRLYLYPNNAEAQNILVDVNVWAEDYVLDGNTDEFLQHGFEFMQWATIVEVNRLLQTYVARQEGNIAPPNNDRDRALKELIEFDIYQSEIGDTQLD